MLAGSQAKTDKKGRYTQKFVQPEHFSDLQLDTNIFNLQIYLKRLNLHNLVA